jgi:hypothetical protein
MSSSPNLGNAGSVAFVAADDFIKAIDQAAAERGETRSHYIRRLVADYLRAEGYLAPNAAVTNHAARRLSGAAR